MPDEKGHETEEETAERLRIVRATQIFGDTPTDPTIGDVVVPVPDEEGAGADLAAANADAEDSDDPDLLSDAEVKRQGATPQFEEAAEDADDDEGRRLAAAVIADIEDASSVEEVDALVEGDERVIVQRAADSKREELGE